MIWADETAASTMSPPPTDDAALVETGKASGRANVRASRTWYRPRPEVPTWGVATIAGVPLTSSSVRVPVGSDADCATSVPALVSTTEDDSPGGIDPVGIAWEVLFVQPVELDLAHLPVLQPTVTSYGLVSLGEDDG